MKQWTENYLKSISEIEARPEKLSAYEAGFVGAMRRQKDRNRRLGLLHRDPRAVGEPRKAGPHVPPSIRHNKKGNPGNSGRMRLPPNGAIRQRSKDFGE